MTLFESPFGTIDPPPLSITERVFQGLADRPDAPVLIDGLTGEIWRAGAIVEAVKRLGGGLAARGWGLGRTVAIMAPNCPRYAIAFHGAAWAGATVTPVNPAYTAEEVRRQLQDAGASLLFAAAGCLETARAAAAGAPVERLIVLDGPGDGDAVAMDDLAGPPLETQAPVDLARHPAALPYSSGTTGLPKGVMLSHRNLAANLDQVLRIFAVEPGEAAVAFVPFFHIYGLNALLNPYLAAGATLVTMPRFDLETFLKLSQDHKAARLWIVPPVALALAQHPAVDAYDLASVRSVFSAAAPLGAPVAAAVARRLGCVVLQGYGMTELSPASHLMSPATAREGAVGQTVPGAQCRVVDPETGRELGVDAEGELWIRGPQVMLGYLNNPAATAETIVDGWLRTGDLACFDADGYLYIRDRLKELIKVKGFQVAPAELEALVLDHPDVADAAVVGQPDDEAGELPVAFVVPRPGVTLDPDAILAHVAGRVATYKRLRRLIPIDAIPKSASGKILRRDLRGRLAE